jgi:hypothetical protein
MPLCLLQDGARVVRGHRGQFRDRRVPLSQHTPQVRDRPLLGPAAGAGYNARASYGDGPRFEPPPIDAPDVNAELLRPDRNDHEP